MNSEPSNPSEQKNEKKTFSRFKLRFFWVLAAIVVFGGGLWLAVNRTPHNEFSWLDRRGYMHVSGRVGSQTWRHFKDKVHRWILPVLAHFQKNQPGLFVSAGAVAFVPPLQDELKLFGQPLATNASGVRAWFLPEGNLFELADHLEKKDNAATLLRATGTFIRSGSPTAFSKHYVLNISGTPQVLGPGVDVTTTHVRGALDVLLNAADVDLTTSPTNALPTPTVLFDVSCHLVITNGGIIVLEGPASGANSRTNYLFMIFAGEIGQPTKSKPNPK